MKKSQFLNITGAFLVFLISFGTANHVLLAQNLQNPLSTSSTAPADNTPQKQPNSASIVSDDNLFQQASKRYSFLNLVKQELAMAQNDYANIRKNTEGTQEKLDRIRVQSATLEFQLKNLDQQIQNSIDLVQNILYQIAAKENGLKLLIQNIEDQKTEIEKQKEVFLEYLKMLYEQEGQINNTAADVETVNVTKLLLLNQPIGEILQEKRYFGILTETGQQIYSKLDFLLQQQEKDKTEMENTRNNLEMLYRQLEQDRQNLEIQREAKAKILEETQGQEQIYQDLLTQSKLEQDDSLRDIQALRNNLVYIQKKVNELGGTFNPDDFKNIFDEKTTSLYEYLQNSRAGDEILLMWPVSPGSGISAYFHDSGYQSVFGVAHQAIDIRASQSTPIHAPADGIVFKTKDSGYGYSYIILAHQNGFMTVYGHVSEIDVKEGDKITRGQVIGLSGATPGTKGAGLMTTGPHLHFEVLKGGVHVDPLDYLPLSYLAVDSLPARYRSRITGDQFKVRREGQTSNSDTADVIKKIEANGMVETSAHDEN